MNILVLDKALDMFKSLSDLCAKVLDAADPKKYAEAVKELNTGVSDTYEAMRNVIINSEKFTDDEKVKRLSELADQEAESKMRCADAIKGNRESVTKVVLDVLKGFLTCGIYFVPGIAKNFKVALAEKDGVIGIESGETSDLSN